MKKMYIHGSFMNDNYGDFLLFYMANNICQEYQKYGLHPFSADVDSSYKDYCNFNELSKVKAIFSADMALFAGGGYFGEPNKRKVYWNVRCLLKHLIPAFIISKRKIPYAIIGVETGPLSFFINRLLLKTVCNNAYVVSVRNEESKSFLKEIGVNREVLVNPDWIMNINPNNLITKKENAKDILKNIPTNYKKIFVHLTTQNNYGKENVISDLKKYIEDKEVFYIVGYDQSRKKIKERCKQLLLQFPKEKSMLFEYSSPWLLSSIISCCDAVITDKLHVGIVATKLNKEVISVASHMKTIRFYKLIKREAWSIYIKEVKQGDILKMLNKLNFCDISISKNVFKEAENNDILLRDFIEKNMR